MSGHEADDIVCYIEEASGEADKDIKPGPFKDPAEFVRKTAVVPVNREFVTFVGSMTANVARHWVTPTLNWSWDLSLQFRTISSIVVTSEGLFHSPGYELAFWILLPFNLFEVFG